MPISRRDFLKRFVVAAGGIGFLNEAQANDTFTDSEAAAQMLSEAEFGSFSHSARPFNILQGPTNETTTQIAVDLPNHFKIHYELTDLQTGSRFSPQLLNSESRPYSLWRVDQIRFDGLQLGHDYVLRAIDDKNRVQDQRTLKALDTQKRDARVAMASCMLEINPKKNEMWRSFEHSAPDVLFMLGDNVYGDILLKFHGPKILWYRYVATRRFVPLYHLPNLIPTFATWDDHDFGLNNVNGDYKHRENSLRVFNAFYAQAPIDGFFERGPGVSSAFDLFGQRIVFLDGRYFRSLESSYGRGLLGDDQLNWAKALTQFSDRPVWFCMGSQFFGGYQRRGDSYESQSSAEFDAFKAHLKSLNQPIILSSGDVHFSEVMHLRQEEFGFQALEMTSSSMHSIPDPTLPKNDRRLAGATKENFIWLDIKDNAPRYKMACVGAREKLRFQHQLAF